MKPNLCLINNILFLVFVLEKPFIFLLYNVSPALSCIPLVLLFCLRVMTSCHHMISFFFFLFSRSGSVKHHWLEIYTFVQQLAEKFIRYTLVYLLMFSVSSDV